MAAKYEVEHKEAKLVGGVLPAVPDFRPIIISIRGKYPDLPEIASEEFAMADVILSEEKIDWYAIREEVEIQVRAVQGLIPAPILDLYNYMQKGYDEPPEIQGREDIPKDIREKYVNAYKLLVQVCRPLEKTVDQYLSVLADRVMEFLLTGKSREIPAGWIATVYASPMMGMPTVIAMAGSLADSKELSADFRRKYTETFGRSRPNITDENINTAELLTRKLNGMKLKDLADIYIERHPEECPYKPNTNDYRAAKRVIEDKLKTRIIRLQETINKMGAR